MSGVTVFSKSFFKVNILFLADPNSVHDIKWMSYFSNEFKCYLIARKEHLDNWKTNEYSEFYSKHHIEIIGSIQDFSIRLLPRTLIQWQKIRRLLNKYNIQIFHVIYADPNSLWAYFRTRSSSPKWILTTRGTDILKGIPGHFNRRDVFNKLIAYLYSRAFRNFDQITCTSYKQKKGVERIVENGNITIIRTGVDVDNILRNTSKFRNITLIDKKYVLFPRNMKPIYNHEFSLAAIKLLPESIRKEYLFVFVDRNSADRDYVNKIVSLMQEDKNTRFLFMNRQSQEEIWQLYKDASLVVMNPLSDGSPVSAMEAMLCRVPLIMGNLEYDRDLFENTVIKLSTWKPEELASAIGAVLTNKAPFNVEMAFSTIIEKGNRLTEMNKLKSLYLSQKGQPKPLPRK